MPVKDSVTPAPQAGEAIARLGAEFAAVNALTPSAPGYRDPQAIVEEGLALLPEEGPAAAGPAGAAPPAAFLLVLAAARALRRQDGAAAAGLLRQALTREQNNLAIQDMLARAEGTGGDAGRLEGRFCPAPFQNLETAPDGRVYFCCPAWLPKPIGNLRDASAAEIWNSPAAQDIRASVHDGSFRHCSRMHCPKLSQDALPRAAAVRDRESVADLAERRLRLDRGPRKVTLAHDRSCNLACPSCRRNLILARKDEQARLNQMAETVILPLLAEASHLRVTSSGDPFGSAHFQHVLRRLSDPAFARVRIEIQTNGLLLTSRLWTELALEGRVEALIASVDAATAPTYEVVRRPGKWAALLRCLAFFAELRRSGRIGRLRLDFVVQALNWREMPAFLELARAHGADGVKFQMIRSWGTWTTEEFLRQDIGARSHPEHPEFIGMLAGLLRERPFAEFWGMPAALAAAERAGRESPAQALART